MNKKKDNYMAVPAAIKELEKIEMIRLSDGNYRLEHAVTSTQKEILKAIQNSKRSTEEIIAFLEGKNVDDDEE